MVSNKLEKESYFAWTNDHKPWSSFMFPNGHNIKWTLVQSKHGICPKLRALGKYFQFISMKKFIANWNDLFTGTKQGLIQKSASTSGQSYSHSMSRFFFFFLNHHHSSLMNKSSSFLVHLHLLHFVIIKKISIFKRKNLQNHIPKEKSPMNKSSIKISKFLQKIKIS